METGKIILISLAAGVIAALLLMISFVFGATAGSHLRLFRYINPSVSTSGRIGFLSGSVISHGMMVRFIGSIDSITSKDNNQPIYTNFLENPNKFSWLNNPDQINWERFA